MLTIFFGALLEFRFHKPFANSVYMSQWKNNTFPFCMYGKGRSIISMLDSFDPLINRNSKRNMQASDERIFFFEFR